MHPQWDKIAKFADTMEFDIAPFLAVESQMVRIGRGSCGTVWTNPCDTDEVQGRAAVVVIKTGEGCHERSISNEHRIHREIQRATKDAQQAASAASTTLFRVNIPYNFILLPPSDLLWGRFRRRLPWSPSYSLISERVLPLHRQLRRSLFKKFCDGAEGANNAESVAAEGDDELETPCLIRTYLGRRHLPHEASPMCPAELRTFSLHADEMEQLGLPAEEYAAAMAGALAFLHWTVRIDANDVEFVLGRPRAAGLDTATAVGPKPFGVQPSIGAREFAAGTLLGPHAMWLLDFDRCQPLPMTSEGIRTAASRFWQNKPYFPVPNGDSPEDKRLWATFRNTYLDASFDILRGEAEHLRGMPLMVIMLIVENAPGRKPPPEPAVPCTRLPKEIEEWFYCSKSKWEDWMD